MKPRDTDTQPDGRSATPQPDIEFIRLKEVIRISGKSRSSVYAAIKTGDFPRQVKIHGRASAWVKSEILEWAAACIRSSRP